MLLNKSLKEGDVVTLKMVSGEEVIARFVEETATGVKVLKPLVLAQGPQGIGMAPYLFTVHPETNIVINHPAIAVMAAPDKMASDQYLQTTTGIKLA
jgi:hypothetical protein